LSQVDTGVIGRPIEIPDAVWDERDVLLYAVGVGAGQDDPYAELEFTTENSEGKQLRVLPTFGVILSHRVTEAAFRGIDIAAVVHAEQALELAGPLPVSGRAVLSAQVTEIWDKGRGALMVVEGAAHNAATGDQLLSVRSSIFVRGAGGFGGERGPSTAWSAPERTPDHVVEVTPRPDQALTYRLSGDRNALHVDPEFARRAGFERPILHGLCTFGYTGRALLHAVCGSDPARFGAIEARFTAPVIAGQTLRIDAWEEGDEVTFRTVGPQETTVLDRGVLRRV
jgi:acyl dehydratase